MSNFNRGDNVAIINRTLGGRFLVETKNATVLKHLGNEQYSVGIDGAVHERFIDPAAQGDPDAFVARLNASVQS